METIGNEKKSKRNGAMSNSRVGIIDKATGEVIDEGSLIYVPKRMRIKGFFMGMQEGFELLAKSKLNGEALHVLLYLISQMDYENVIRISQKSIGENLAMQKQNVSRAMKALREAGIIDPTTCSAVQLCPDFGWKGKVQNLRKRQSELFNDSIERASQTPAELEQIELMVNALAKHPALVSPPPG